MKPIENRHELLFLYDVKDINPNGDPSDENKPRIDEETGHNIVTDVRLKRTIRDYLFDHKNQEVFVREVRKNDGILKTKEQFLSDLKVETPEDLIDRCIDIRLFGATAAIKKKTITFTGPVQFRFGRSLHKVALTFVKGTTVMPSKQGQMQGTFTEVYILPYSLIAFYGIVNENAGKHTKLSEEDVLLLLESMWEGTKNLISRSKVGQMPRLLLDIQYKKKNYHIGDLDKMIALKSELSSESLRDISDLRLDLSMLIDKLKKEKEKIHSIRWKADDRVETMPKSLQNLLDEFNNTELSF